MELAFRTIDPSLVVDNEGCGFRCAIETCILHCSNDTRCQKALTKPASLVVFFIGGNDAKIQSWNVDAFRRDWLKYCQRFQNMTSKPDIFVVNPPPLYKDGLGVSMAQNKIITQIIPELRKECGADDDQFINLYESMGGQELSHPEMFCDFQFCDGYHPADIGHTHMAYQVMTKIMNFRLKKYGNTAKPKTPQQSPKK